MEFLLELSAQYPTLSTILMIIGSLRLLIKPLMSFLHEFVKITPTPNDNSWLEKMESSKYWKAILYFMDWFGSIKLKNPSIKKVI